MRIFGWAQAFNENQTIEDIPSRVHKMEVAYWVWLLLTFLGSVVGLIMLGVASSLKVQLFGLFFALEGVTLICLIKIWAHVRLTQYWIIWDSRNRLDAEMRKSEAADL